MFDPAKLLVCGLVVLTGCSTASRRADKEGAPDWEAPELATAAPPVSPMPAPAVLPTPAPAHTNQITETWVPLNRWAELNKLTAGTRLATDSSVFALTAGEEVMVFEAGSRSAHWNGLELQLGFAPRVVNDELLVHTLDVQKNLQPLLNPAGRITAPAVVVVDPGHGGSDAGASNVFSGRFEKDYTLDWAKRLQPLLAAKGWEVFLTRTNDTRVSLAERVAFAELHKASLFLSLHFNSAYPSQSQAGLESYCLTPTGMPSNLTRGHADDTTLVFPNNAFDEENLRHALRLHQALLEVNGNLDRGVRRARFLGVLRGQNRPAVLLEGGYLSNPQEAREIADPAYRQKLAEAVAGALSE